MSDDRDALVAAEPPLLCTCGMRYWTQKYLDLCTAAHREIERTIEAYRKEHGCG